MKGIVIEFNNDEAAVLSDNGSVRKIKNKNYELGQVVKMKNNKMNIIKKAGSIAAVLALVTAGSFAYATPSTYVSLDVNPSIEYTVNTFGRVLSVKAVNDDAEVITSDLTVKNMKISKAVQVTIDKLREGGYFEDNENAGIVIAISNSDEDNASEMADELEEETQEYVEEIGETADVDAEAVGKERVEEARELGVTPGKLNLVQKLVASTEGIEDAEEIDIEEWLNKSVKEINKAIKENRKQLEEADDAEDENEEEVDVEVADEEDDSIEENVKSKNKSAKESAEKNKEKNDDKNSKNEYSDDKDDDEDLEEDLEDEEEDEDEDEEDEEDDEVDKTAKSITNKSTKETKETKK